MEEGQKITWALFIVTCVGVLVALSQYIFPWPRLLFGNVHTPVVKKSSSQPILSGIPTQKPVPNIFYTKEQLATHNTTDSCWFSLSGQVYDVSQLTRSYKQIPNVSQICGNDITETVGSVIKQYGVKDISQLTLVLSQYTIGKLK